MANLLSIEEFADELRRYWDLDSELFNLDEPLEEQGVDSLGKLELIVMLEDFAGHEMPDELWSDSVTLRDIYQSYEEYASRSHGPPAEF